MSVNIVAITGNLTRKPELTAAGTTQILRMSVAVNERRKINGEWTDVPNYVDCIMFGTRAESVSRFLDKGMKVSIAGSLRYSSWPDKTTGKTRSKLEVVVNELDIMQRSQGKAGAPVQQPQQTELYDSDIPF